jgi:hypothetical protein
LRIRQHRSSLRKWAKCLRAKGVTCYQDLDVSQRS